MSISNAALLFSIVIVSILMVTGVSADETLMAYWPLDNNVQDMSGNGNHGEIRGEPQQVNGIVGKALEFDGVDDFIFVEDSDSLDITDALTLSAWVKPAVIPASAERKVVYKTDAYLIKVKNRRTCII